jgi:hypothetical protein
MEKLHSSAAEMYPHHRQLVRHKGTGPATTSYLLQYPDLSEDQECTDISAMILMVGERNRQHHLFVLFQ